tara:strand:- start:3737 stop:4186 length:450 start_codon:yes stop_codon:yes gene_type:complete
MNARADHSAGILPLYQDHILLGKESRGWSAFGGKSEEGETPHETAIREFTEETAGIFGGVQLDMTTSSLVKTVTPKGNPFFLYLIELPCISEVNSIFQEKRKVTKNRREKEKKEIKWVEISKVKNLRLSTAFAADWDAVRGVIKNMQHL